MRRLHVMVLLAGALMVPGCATKTGVQPDPRIRFCTLPPGRVAQGQEFAKGDASLNSMAVEIRRQLSIEGSARLGEPIDPPACDAIALRLVAAGAVELIPMAMYALGAGFYVYQPGSRGSEAWTTIIGPSFNVISRTYTTD